MIMAPWAVMLGLVGTCTRVENVICDHRVACLGNWEGDLDFRLAVWVHCAACLLHFFFGRGWQGQFIGMGNLGKVMVAGLSAVFGAWICMHVTEFACEARDLALCCIIQGN